MAAGQDLHQQAVQAVCFLETAVYGQYLHTLCYHAIKVLPVTDKDKFTSVPNLISRILQTTACLTSCHFLNATGSQKK
jgi:hypothetical protein